MRQNLRTLANKATRVTPMQLDPKFSEERQRELLEAMQRVLQRQRMIDVLRVTQSKRPKVSPREADVHQKNMRDLKAAP